MVSVSYRLSDNMPALKAERRDNATADHMTARKWLKRNIAARHAAPVSVSWASPSRMAEEHAREIASLHQQAMRNVGF